MGVKCLIVANLCSSNLAVNLQESDFISGYRNILDLFVANYLKEAKHKHLYYCINLY